MTSASTVTLEGLLGDALTASRTGRLSHFVVDETSPPIALFAAAHRDHNHEGDWYGEHAGKWLYAAAKAAARSGDATLRGHVRRVADFLVAQQASDGYLGTYAPERRFVVKRPPKPLTWDGAPTLRTWDVWTHAYLVVGLLEVHRHFPDTSYLDAACRIGDLCWNVLSSGAIDITELGNHHGLSATVLVDPAVELHRATGNPRYLRLARLVVEQAEAHPPLALLSRATAGADASEFATGKAYQLLWNCVGLAKLYRATGDDIYREAADHVWENVRDYHLTPGGGPWGGVGHRSREVFNAPGFFSPHGYVETCSVLAWIQLNRELLAIDGDPKYADEIERAAYNALLGAMAPNGEDWCYYTFDNGERVHTTAWRCCKSSGAMALEELPDLVYRATRDGAVAIDLFEPGHATVTLVDGQQLRIEQRTRYPFDGAIAIDIETAVPGARIEVRVRIPSWAVGARVTVCGVSYDASGADARITRNWNPGDTIDVDFPMPVVTHQRGHENVQESRAPDGSTVRQRVLNERFVALTRGALVYATGLVDGYRVGETIRMPDLPLSDWLVEVPGVEGPDVRMRLADRDDLVFSPWYRTGGRVDGAWRLTWLSLPPSLKKESVAAKDMSPDCFPKP